MTTTQRYWQIVRLDSSGKTRTDTLSTAQSYFEQNYPQIEESDIVDRAIVKALWQVMTQEAVAFLCLRCNISHQIFQVCLHLERQFGNNYGFSLADLLPYVLDDDGRSNHSTYQPLSYQILQKFDPERSSLSTWTAKLVKQHRELNSFLLQHGIYLLSDWAILNDTNPKKLQRILSDFHRLTATEITSAIALLESYHAVYRQERLRQRQQGQTSGQCPPPTTDQLQQIAQHLQPTKAIAPDVILHRLQALAQRLRQHRLHAKGNLATTSIDDPHAKPIVEAIALSEPDDETAGQTKFLQSYRQQMLAALDKAFEQAIAVRLQGKSSKAQQKAQIFAIALQLFHCQGMTMGEIATQVGLKAQFEVTRLLKLKEFRTDVRHYLLQDLQEKVRDLAADHIRLERLRDLDSAIVAALTEQVDQLMRDAESDAKTAKSYTTGALFSRRLCEYLDHLALTPSPSPKEGEGNKTII
jgi:hypothetical protein